VVNNFLGRRTSEIRLNEVESVVMAQGPFAKRDNYGNFTANGRGHGGVTLIRIEDPNSAKKWVEIELEKYKQEPRQANYLRKYLTTN